MVGNVGAYGQLTQGTIFCNPRTKYKRSKNVFAVTCIALSCKHIWAQLLQPLVQSLIGSPGTLEGAGTRPDYFVNRVLTKNEGPHEGTGTPYYKQCGQLQQFDAIGRHSERNEYGTKSIL